MAVGTVKWFDPKKGYGFVAPEDGGKDVFIHISDLQRSNLTNLKEGQQISFETKSEKGKTSAINIKIV